MVFFFQKVKASDLLEKEFLEQSKTPLERMPSINIDYHREQEFGTRRYVSSFRHPHSNEEDAGSYA